MAMAWIGIEDADNRGRSPRPETVAPTDWLVRTRVDGLIVETRVRAVSEREAHRLARRLGDDYTLSRL
jgi:hypothetical protein